MSQLNAAEKLSLLNKMNDEWYFQPWIDFLEQKKEELTGSIIYSDKLSENNEIKYSKNDLIRMIIWLIDEIQKEPVQILAEVEWAISYEELSELQNSLTSNKRMFNKIKEVLGIDDIKASE